MNIITAAMSQYHPINGIILDGIRTNPETKNDKYMLNKANANAGTSDPFNPFNENRPEAFEEGLLLLRALEYARTSHTLASFREQVNALIAPFATRMSIA